MDGALRRNPCVMPETTSPPTETPSSPPGGTRRLAPTLCCFGTKELAGPWAAAGRRRALLTPPRVPPSGPVPHRWRGGDQTGEGEESDPKALARSAL